RLSVYSKQLQPIDFDTIIQAYLNPPGADAPWTSVWGPARLLTEFHKVFPVVLRNPRYFLRLMKTAVRDLVDMKLRPDSFAREVAPGDIVVSLGASWGFPDYAKHIAAAKKRYGFKFSTLVHDIIPVENEGFVHERHVLQFRERLDHTLPNADIVLTVSRPSPDALTGLAASAGLALAPGEVL